MEYKDYVIGFVMILVVFIAVNTFLSGMAVNYGYDESYMQDERIDLTGMSANISSLESDTQQWERSFREENLFLAVGVLALESIWGIIKLMLVVPVAMFSLIATGSIGVLGVPALIVGALLDILLIALIVGAWKMLKNP